MHFGSLRPITYIPHQHPILVEPEFASWDIGAFSQTLHTLIHLLTPVTPQKLHGIRVHSQETGLSPPCSGFSPRRHPAFAESCDGKLENVEIFMSSYENVLTERAALYVPRRNIKVACVFINIRRSSSPNQQLMCELGSSPSKHVISATFISLPHPFLQLIE